MSPQAASAINAPAQRWGQIVTPASFARAIAPDRIWCMDNGVFTGAFSETAFWQKLEHLRPWRDSCKFVVAPDVVGNAIATMHAFRYWGPAIHAAGWPVAFVAQDGQELFDLPPEFDALFVGGSTEWKMSYGALDAVQRAKADGRWTHVGRVNSLRRIRHFRLAGVDSVDGTSVVFAPDKNYALLDRALRQPPLFTMEV